MVAPLFVGLVKFLNILRGMNNNRGPLSHPVFHRVLTVLGESGLQKTC